MVRRAADSQSNNWPVPTPCCWLPSEFNCHGVECGPALLAPIVCLGMVVEGLSLQDVVAANLGTNNEDLMSSVTMMTSDNAFDELESSDKKATTRWKQAPPKKLTWSWNCQGDAKGLLHCTQSLAIGGAHPSRGSRIAF